MKPEFDAKSMDLLDRLKKAVEQGAEDTLQEAVKQVGLETIEQMNHNLGGESVSWSGGNFRINVQTGNLRRRVRMEYPFAGDPYTAFVHNDASYAPDLITGMSGAEKKRRLLEGGSSAKVSKEGRKYKRIPGGPGSLVRFWTVTEESTLKNQPPRPFVEATAEQMAPRAVQLFGAAIIEAITPK